jgi:hypothetical protein
MNLFNEEVTLEGHIIDSWTLPRAFDTIMDMGGTFDVEEIQVGRAKDEVSFARLKIHAATEKKLDSILMALQPFGAVLASRDDVAYSPRQQMVFCRPIFTRPLTCPRRCA